MKSSHDKALQCDKTPTICRADNIHDNRCDNHTSPLFDTSASAALSDELVRLAPPASARLSLNRCNLSTEALSSLAFQLAPVPLELDGVLPLHRPLLDVLDTIQDRSERARVFHAYMRAHFLLDDPRAQGLTPNARIDRSRLDYLRVLRGWLFDPDGREAAVLKGWVESRFGLLTEFHRGTIHHGPESSARRARFERQRAAGLYATGALEAQIDLLYTYAQYELARQHPGRSHIVLYRGLSGPGATRPLATLANGSPVLQLNNLSSFSASRERADEFGDRVLICAVPLAKVLAYASLLPGRMQGEDEYLVIGGVVHGNWATPA